MAVTGADTSSNSLFGVLQVTAAKEAGLDPTLLAAANSSGGVLGKMISPQNLAIGAAAVGLDGEEGELFRRVVGWSLALLLDHVRARVSAIHGGVVMDGRVSSRTRARRDAPRASGIVGPDHGSTRPSTSCARTSPTGCSSTAATPAAAVLPSSAEEVQAVVQAVRAGGDPVGGARRRVGAERRRAAGQGRRAGRALADEADPRDRPRQRPRVRGAGRDQRERERGRRAGVLLSARPVLADRVLDRRQRGRELRRRALLQVRLHDQLRHRAGAGARRRGAGDRSAATSWTRPATTCSARSSAPRARWAWPRRSGCASCRRRRR